MASLREVPAEIRRNVRASYLEKLFVVLIAIVAFFALANLGEANKREIDTKVGRYRLNQKTLKKVAHIADGIAGTAAAKDAATLLRTTVSQFTHPDGTEKTHDGFATPGELAAAVEHLVDVQIWSEYTQTVATASTPPAKKDDVRTDLLFRAEARARGLTAASHPLIESAVLKLPVDKPSGFDRIYDDEDSLHVMFEILWYASLIIGVVAASYLLLIVFAALPFTSLEGYWTKRVRNLVNQVGPGVAVRSVAGLAAIGPLAAAVAIAGTVISATSYATVPGGSSRTTIVHEREPVTIDNSVHPQSPVGGATTIDNSVHPQSPPIITGIDEKDFDKGLADTRDAVNGVTAQKYCALDSRITEAQGRLDNLDRSIQHGFMDASEGASVLARKAWEVGSRSEAKIDGVSAKLRSLDTIEDATTKMYDAQMSEDKIDDHLLAQAAVADSRGFWGRTFGMAQFWVGPAVIDVMRANLGPRASLDGTAEYLFVEALSAMHDNEPPHTFIGFDRALYARTPIAAKKFIRPNRRALLRLCALPRE